MTQSLLPLLGAAAGAMVQVLIIATVGYICAKRPKDPAPLLTPDALKVISRVANDVFLPCLSAAVLGARINVANLKGDWVLLPAGVAATALGYAVADLTAAILRPTPALKPALRVAIAHPNAFALPLLILQYLCERPSVKEEFDNDEAACTAEAAASLCLYLTAWHFVFWSYAYGTLEDAAKAREERPLLASLAALGRAEDGRHRVGGRLFGRSPRRCRAAGRRDRRRSRHVGRSGEHFACGRRCKVDGAESGVECREAVARRAVGGAGGGGIYEAGLVEKIVLRELKRLAKRLSQLVLGALSL